MTRASMAGVVPGRPEGALVGAAVGAAFLAGATLLVSLAPQASVAGFLADLGLPTLLTGAIVGWLFGRRGWREQRWHDRGITSLGMAFLATAVGDYLVGVMLGLESAISQWRYAAQVGTLTSTGWESVGMLVGQAVVGGLLLWPFGLLFFGIIAVPVTFAAGLIWAWIMGWLGRASRA